jgi:hypothetical protein
MINPDGVHIFRNKNGQRLPPERCQPASSAESICNEVLLNAFAFNANEGFQASDLKRDLRGRLSCSDRRKGKVPVSIPCLLRV